MRMHNHKATAGNMSELRSLLIIAGGLAGNKKPAAPRPFGGNKPAKETKKKKMDGKEFVQQMAQTYAASAHRDEVKRNGTHKPAKKADAPHKGHSGNKPATPQTQAMERATITLPRGKEFLLMLECSPSDIPKEVQIIAGSPTPRTQVGQQPATPVGTRFKCAKVDLKSLLARARVKSMNVTNTCGYHVLYIRCEEVGKNGVDLGFNHWKGPYAQLAEKLGIRTWTTAVFKDQEGQSSLTLRKQQPVEKQAERKIFFAIEPATQQVAE